MINVIGLGYIGLPTALMMASHGVEVVGTDYNKDLVSTLNAGRKTVSMSSSKQLSLPASSLPPNISAPTPTLCQCPPLTTNSPRK